MSSIFALFLLRTSKALRILTSNFWPTLLSFGGIDTRISALNLEKTNDFLKKRVTNFTL
jgi:hypothetical protein